MNRIILLILMCLFCQPAVAGVVGPANPVSDTDKMVERKLARKITVVAKHGTLEVAMKLIAKESKIRFDVRWDQLELVGATEDVLVDLNYRDTPAKEILEEVFKVASQDGIERGDRVGYVIKRGVIIVDTYRNLGL